MQQSVKGDFHVKGVLSLPHISDQKNGNRNETSNCHYNVVGVGKGSVGVRALSRARYILKLDGKIV